MQHVADVRVRLIDFVENDDPRLLDKSGNQAEHEGRFRASWRCDLPERADDLCTGEIAIERDLVHGKPDASTELFEEFGFRSEEHTSELQSLMRHSYAVFCLKKKKSTKQH